MHPHSCHPACPPGTALRAVTARLGDAALCYLGGTLDPDDAEAARDALDRTLAMPCPLICVDLRDLGFCSCTGLNLFLQARLTARQAGRTLVLLSPSPQVERLLRLSETEDLFPVQPDVRHALATRMAEPVATAA
ncbi:STAS domain-containing protein [Kitasatospora paranensis]|uniref:STAS domain-containing protein n=2 Tax=Kitasatospora paranensis TaxID=258053 RepID=A0ABW2G830_9ACTN